MHRQRVVAAAALALLCVVEATSHGGNYGRRTYRYQRPSWTYDPRGRGAYSGPYRQFANIGKRASDFGVDQLPTDLSVDIRGASFRDSGFPGGYYGRGGVPGRFPDSGGSEVRFPDSEGRFLGSGGSEVRFSDSKGRFPGSGGSEVRFPDSEGRFPGSGGSEVRFPDSEGRFPGSGGSGRFPGTSLPGGDFAGAGQGGDNIVADKFNDLSQSKAGAPSGGRCPLTRPSCTTSRTRAQYCESDTCGPGRKCCFDACLQRDICKTTI